MGREACGCSCNLFGCSCPLQVLYRCSYVPRASRPYSSPTSLPFRFVSLGIGSKTRCACFDIWRRGCIQPHGLANAELVGRSIHRPSTRWLVVLPWGIQRSDVSPSSTRFGEPDRAPSPFPLSHTHTSHSIRRSCLPPPFSSLGNGPMRSVLGAYGSGKEEPGFEPKS